MEAVDLSQNTRDGGSGSSSVSSGRFIEFEIIDGARAGTKILYSSSEKMMYTKQHELKKYIVYRCKEKNCSSRLWLKPSGVCVKADKFVNHNHADMFADYNKLCVRKQITEAATNASSNIQQAYRKVVKE